MAIWLHMLTAYTKAPPNKHQSQSITKWTWHLVLTLNIKVPA